MILTLKLLLVKWCYGPWSTPYLRSAVKCRKRLPGRKMPFRECFAEEMIVHLDGLIRMIDTGNPIQTSKPLIFEQVPYGIRKRDLLKRIGNPYCAMFESYHDETWEMLGYRGTRYQQPVRIFFFFLNDAFFFGEYRLGETRHEGLLTRPGRLSQTGLLEDLPAFVMQVAGEYHPGSPGSARELFLRDAEGRCLCTAMHGDYFYVRFLDAGNAATKESLSSLIGKGWRI